MGHTYYSNETNLEGLAEKFNVIIFDTCAIKDIHPLSNEKSKYTKSEHSRFLEALIEKINQRKPFFIPRHVPKELMQGVKEFERYVGVNKFSKKRKRVKNKLKDIYSDKELSQDLIKFFWEENRILKLTKGEKRLSNEVYNSLRVPNELSPSENDKRFLSAGFAIYKNSGKTALISNDGGILRMWNSLIIEKKLSGEEFAFFTRNRTDGFEQKAKYTSFLS